MSNRFEQMRKTLKTGVEVVSSPLLYPTPPNIAARMVTSLELFAGAKVLEPSAGTGNLIRELDKSWLDLDVEAIEIDPKLLSTLYKFKCSVRHADFLTVEPSPIYDRVIMNPPFNGGQDIKHINHALKFLKGGGVLVGICAAGPRQEKQIKPLTEWWEPLAVGTFKDAGTMVNSVLFKIRKENDQCINCPRELNDDGLCSVCNADGLPAADEGN